jgi:hypothetical protein
MPTLTFAEKNFLSQRLAYHLDKDSLQTLLFELSIALGPVNHCTLLELAQLLVRHADNSGKTQTLLLLASELNNTVSDWLAPLSTDEQAQHAAATGQVFIDRSVHLHGSNTVGVISTGEQAQLSLEQQTLHAASSTDTDQKK